MLTEEQVRAIVDSRVKLLKGYSTLGELKRDEKKRDYPWPEFWTGYNQCVRERDELAVHIEYGVFPHHLIKSRSPNQTPEEFEYVRENFKQVTLPNSIDFLNTIARADSNWSIRYSDEDGDFAEYMRNSIGELGDFVVWSNSLLPKMKIMDPMGIICTMPKSIPTIEGQNENGEPVLMIDPDEMVDPQPNYFPVDKVWGYEHGVWYCLLTDEHSLVRKGGREVNEGYVMWIVDDTKCWRAYQYGDAYKLNFAIEEYFEHDQGYPPCIFLMGTPTLKGGKVIYQSSYLPCKPAFDTVLLDTTYLSMVKSNSAYPYRVMLGNDCQFIAPDMGRCDGGILKYAKEDGTIASGGKCPNCKGTGLSVNLGPNGYLIVHAMKRGDTAQTSVHDAMTFVEPTATTMDFLRREIVDQTNEGRKMMHLSAEAPMVGGDVKTATQSGIDLRSTIAFIKPIAEQLFTVREFTVDSIAIQRYGKDGAKDIYTMTKPTSYDIRTEADHLTEWTSSSTLPPSMRQVALEGYIEMRYASDQTMKEAFAAIAQADRLFVLSAMEIAALQTARSVAPWEVALHNEALSIYDRLSQQDAFMRMDKFAKAKAIKKFAQDAYPAVQGGDIVQRLVGAANAQ